jgi:peptidyl-prolyl cis-trans isomerase C
MCSHRLLFESGFRALFLLCILGLLALLTGCEPAVPVVPTSTVTATREPTATVQAPSPTLAVPTMTAEPLAARVDGEGILLAEYEAELDRYVSAGFHLDEDARRKVMEELINQTLLAQSAFKEGYEVSDADLEQRITDLQSQTGEQALVEWMDAYGYSPESFRRSLRRAAAAAWMRDQIIALVPDAAEQVQASQILLFNEEQANQVLAQVRAGTSFEALSARYDPVSRGDLGWFPQGYLPVRVVEEAAFNLQPGQVSDVIESDIGFHIVQVIAREQDRPLESDALLVLQLTALKEWLIQRQVQTNIELLLPLDG